MENQKVFDFVGKRKIFFTIPIVIAVIAIVINCIFGLEIAIEFRGGTMLSYSYEGEIDTDAVKSTVENAGYGAVVVTTGTSVNGEINTVQISFASSKGLTADVQTELSNKLDESYKDNKLTLINSQDVNPSSGAIFFVKCLVAVLFSFVLLVIYIAFRFKKIGGLSAGVFSLVALIHDLVMIYAVFVFLRYPVDANFMAVILTILGNSINNTIVVYDRIRENRNLYGDTLTIRELVNLSITQSITRAINTTLTTGFAVLTICVVCSICGVTSIMTFALPMFIGLLCGAYSSMFIAGPLWVMWQERKGKKYLGKDKTDGSKDKNRASNAAPDAKKLMV